MNDEPKSPTDDMQRYTIVSIEDGVALLKWFDDDGNELRGYSPVSDLERAYLN